MVVSYGCLFLARQGWWCFLQRVWRCIPSYPELLLLKQFDTTWCLTRLAFLRVLMHCLHVRLAGDGRASIDHSTIFVGSPIIVGEVDVACSAVIINLLGLPERKIRSASGYARRSLASGFCHHLHQPMHSVTFNLLDQLSMFQRNRFARNNRFQLSNLFCWSRNES